MSACGLENLRVVDLFLIAEHVGVGVSRHGEIALSDMLADPRPRNTRQVPERDTAVAKVVRREHGNANADARPPNRHAQAVGSDALEHAPVGVTVVARAQLEYGFEHDRHGSGLPLC